MHIKHEEKLHMIKRDSSSFKYRGLGAFARRKFYVKRHCASSKSKQLESSKSQTPHLTEVLYSIGSHPAPPTALPALCVLQYRVVTPDLVKLSLSLSMIHTVWLYVWLSTWISNYNLSNCSYFSISAGWGLNITQNSSHSESPKLNLKVENKGAYKHSRSETKHPFLFKILLPFQVISLSIWAHL